MKKNYLKTLIVTGAVVLSFGIVMAADRNFPAEDITLEGKRPVPFSHKTHVDLGVTCTECHHDGDHQPLTASQIEAMGNKAMLKCNSCHNEHFKNKDLQEKKDIFHTNCRGCHSEGFENRKGPMKCSSCHVRKQQRTRMIEGC